MVRLELIANRSVEDEIMEQMNLIGCDHFTRIPIAYGQGNHEPKQGDSIWPEMNFVMIIYCEENKIEPILTAVNAVKIKFPNEGIRLFKVPAEPVS